MIRRRSNAEPAAPPRDGARRGVLLDPRLPARFWAKVAVDAGGCWLWTAGRTGRAQEYGAYWLNGHNARAHRVAYGALVEPVPETLHVDHLCRNTLCVNPAHLEPVTPRDNMMRGRALDGVRAYFEARTTCPNGHPYTPDNLLQRHKRRRCRACARAGSQRAAERKRQGGAL